MSQINLFGESEEQNSRFKICKGLNVIENGNLLFLPNFFERDISDIFFYELRNQTFWKQESMSMYGKMIPFPRLTAWYGDFDKPYSFSGLRLTPHPWTQTLLDIKNLIEAKADAKFNSVLLNLYRNGNDSISWHTDAERELGLNPTIASVNFGETRTFQLRHIETKKRIDIELSHGSLLIMFGELQHHWQHQVPKNSKLVNERINLTFRVLK